MPRAKRSKQYRKLMNQFAIGFGFHVPYQVLVDADFLAESMKCKMEIIKRLEDTLHGEVKPLITQCSMRHLYNRKSEPGVYDAIELAKAHFERRRCGHHPDEYPEPLSAHECIGSVVDPKQSGVNKHRYVCAVNDDGVRAALRRVPGVPLIFIRRSVVLMEPMATATARARSAEERKKFRAEIKTPVGGAANKRKRDPAADSDDDGADGDKKDGAAKQEKKKTKKSGPKGPNPLSVKKKKSTASQPESKPKTETTERIDTAADGNDATTDQPKKKRKRKHRGGDVDGGAATQSTETGTEAPITKSEA